MSKYVDLRNNRPTIKVKKDAREVIYTTISCMCDNVHKLRFSKNRDGDFRMSGGMFALSNWQFKYDVSDIEWAADEQDWSEVERMINSSTEVIEKVKSR